MSHTNSVFYRKKTSLIQRFVHNLKLYIFFHLLCIVPRSGPRNMRVFDPTTSTLSVSWEHAQGPVVEYRITYAQTTGDPIEEYVSIF